LPQLPADEFGDGELMSSGVDVSDNYRRAAVFVDRILKGANPADLPVEEPTKNETRRPHRGSRPRSVLARADDLIE
jgi:putative ABC transport system substrate-binding protein